jgi:hypothetical protein
MRYFVLPPGVHLHCFDATATPQTPILVSTQLFCAYPSVILISTLLFWSQLRYFVFRWGISFCRPEYTCTVLTLQRCPKRLWDAPDAAMTPQTPLRRLTHLFKATETPQPLEPLYRLSDALKTMGVMWFDFKSILLKVDENRTNKTLLSVKYINTSFKGYKRHFPPKSQFSRAGAGLQAKYIGHL